jgi:hypothetical protein
MRTLPNTVKKKSGQNLFEFNNFSTSLLCPLATLKLCYFLVKIKATLANLFSYFCGALNKTK